MARVTVQPRILGPGDYDHSGRPIGKLTVTWHRYELALGTQTCWLAAYADLPGYYGEGGTIEHALERLWQSLGPQPHYQVDHVFRTAKKLKADIERGHNAMAAALRTRARSWGVNLGGGEGVDETAKAYGVGKTAVNAARSKLSDAIDARSGELIFGLGAGSLAISEGLTEERISTDLSVARETPWRLEHAAARKLFPSKIPD